MAAWRIIYYMTGFAHAITGAAIGLALRNPWLVVPAALLSHFVLDALPHFHHHSFGDSSRRPWSASLRRMIALDATLVLASIVAMLTQPHLRGAILLGITSAMLPDLLWPLRGAVARLESFFRLHQAIQWAEKPWGVWVEAPYCLLMLALLWRAIYT